MAMILLPDGTPFEKKTCPFCDGEYLSVVLDAGTCASVEKVEGVAGGYRLHECDEMLQAMEQALEVLTGSEAYICYNCGNNLEVGVDAADDLCWHCRRDEEKEVS